MDKKVSQTSKPVTLKDIAQSVGVSINTVSGVLNPRSHVRVSPATRQAILDTAQRLHYRRNIAASHLAGGQTCTVGILMESLTHALSAPIADAFEQEMGRCGYQCFVGCTRYDGLQKKEYVERLIAHGINGLLLTTAYNDPEVKTALAPVFDSGIPVVFVDHVWGTPPGPLVCGNHFMGGQLLASHLIDMGHQSMFFLTSQTALQAKSIQDRIHGVRSVLKSEQMPPDSLCVFPVFIDERKKYTDNNTFLHIADAVIEQLESPAPPTAILCANDLTAYCLILGLTQRGMRVPDDVAVTGYDDLHHSFFNTTLGVDDRQPAPWAFPLTTIRQPFDEIGRTAAKLLVRQIEGEKVTQTDPHYLDVNLVVHGSSALPHHR